MGCVSEETLDCLAEAFRYRQQQKRSFRGWNKIVQLSKQSNAEEKCNLLRAEAEEAKNQSQTLKQEVDGLHLELQQLSGQHADALLAAEKAHSIAVSKIVADCAYLRNKMRQQEMASAELQSANSTFRTALTGLMEAEMQRGLEQLQRELNCKLEDIRRKGELKQKIAIMNSWREVAVQRGMVAISEQHHKVQLLRRALQGWAKATAEQELQRWETSMPASTALRKVDLRVAGLNSPSDSVDPLLLSAEPAVYATASSLRASFRRWKRFTQARQEEREEALQQLDGPLDMANKPEELPLKTCFYVWRSTGDTVVTNANCQAVKERFECFLKDRLRREECHMKGHLTYFQAAQEMGKPDLKERQSHVSQCERETSGTPGVSEEFSFGQRPESPERDDRTNVRANDEDTALSEQDSCQSSGGAITPAASPGAKWHGASVKDSWPPPKTASLCSESEEEDMEEEFLLSAFPTETKRRHERYRRMQELSSPRATPKVHFYDASALNSRY